MKRFFACTAFIVMYGALAVIVELIAMLLKLILDAIEFNDFAFKGLCKFAVASIGLVAFAFVVFGGTMFIMKASEHILPSRKGARYKTLSIILLTLTVFTLILSFFHSDVDRPNYTEYILPLYLLVNALQTYSTANK